MWQQADKSYTQWSWKFLDGMLRIEWDSEPTLSQSEIGYRHSPKDANVPLAASRKKMVTNVP